jgi:hypothetical protein
VAPSPSAAAAQAMLLSSWCRKAFRSAGTTCSAAHSSRQQRRAARRGAPAHATCQRCGGPTRPAASAALCARGPVIRTHLRGADGCQAGAVGEPAR